MPDIGGGMARMLPPPTVCAYSVQFTVDSRADDPTLAYRVH